MFVHMRVLELLKRKIKVSVLVPSAENCTYVYEGINVQKRYASEIVGQIKTTDIVYLHLLNIYPFSKADGWCIYKHILKNNISFAMYVHGSEVQKYVSRLYEFNFRIIDCLKWIKKDVFVIPKMKRFLRASKGKKNCAFIFPSLWMKKNMEKNLNTVLETFFIIPNGIETDFFKYETLAHNRFKIVTIRSLSQKVYNIEQTIKVIQLLPEEYSLVIYGEGNFQKKYESMIKILGLQDRITIIDRFVNKVEMRNIFGQYGVFISTTRMDSQGITMMQAMSNGLLVACTNNSSKEEFIFNMKTGVLGTDETELAEGILKVTKNIDDFNKVTLAGSKFMDTISLEKTMNKEIEVLRTLITL